MRVPFLLILASCFPLGSQRPDVGDDGPRCLFNCPDDTGDADVDADTDTDSDVDTDTGRDTDTDEANR